MKNIKVIITEATSGIGKAAPKLFASAGTKIMVSDSHAKDDKNELIKRKASSLLEKLKDRDEPVVLPKGFKVHLYPIF